MTPAGRIVLASGNPGKLREFERLLAGTGVELIPQSRLGVEEAVETGSSFAENAVIKARHAAARTGHPAVADDSGLEVDALGGAPGVHSARYAGNGASDEQNVEKLLAALSGVSPEERGARFVCTIAFVDAADAPPVLCQGIWHGRIIDRPRGANGFGYDPVFFVPECDCTAAELDPDEKNRLSHRGQALRAFLEEYSGSREPVG
ncbi:MAG: RdgB/HAM1 family non-canonical purine NTP pyrophosphatase [Gammaproteobacteria bacterium]|nr:RdgB/HAM1 family non-canonical purine NTP pyrophosphatase [Gammaproteobacteria bacterium]